MASIFIHLWEVFPKWLKDLTIQIFLTLNRIYFPKFSRGFWKLWTPSPTLSLLCVLLCFYFTVVLLSWLTGMHICWSAHFKESWRINIKFFVSCKVTAHFKEYWRIHTKFSVSCKVTISTDSRVFMCLMLPSWDVSKDRKIHEIDLKDQQKPRASGRNVSLGSFKSPHTDQREVGTVWNRILLTFNVFPITQQGSILDQIHSAESTEFPSSAEHFRLIIQRRQVRWIIKDQKRPNHCTFQVPHVTVLTRNGGCQGEMVARCGGLENLEHLTWDHPHSMPSVEQEDAFHSFVSQFKKLIGRAQPRLIEFSLTAISRFMTRSVKIKFFPLLRHSCVFLQPCNTF